MYLIWGISTLVHQLIIDIPNISNISSIYFNYINYIVYIPNMKYIIRDNKIGKTEKIKIKNKILI